jgi:hypothetical protein
MGVTMLWRKKPKNEPDAESGASKNNAQYRWNDGEWRVPPYKHWDASHSDYQADERRYWWHQRWALWANVGVGIATLIAAITAAKIAYWAYESSVDAVIEAKRQTSEVRRQADAAQEQAGVAKETERNQLRAYVLPVFGPFTQSDLSQNPLMLMYKPKNFGLTPAYHVRTSGQLMVAPFFFGFIPKPPHKMITHHGGIEQSYYLAPQGTSEIFLYLSGHPPLLSDDEKAAIINGKDWLLYAVGTIFYDDIFGQPHTTDFRLQFGGEESIRLGGLRTSKEGNAADKDCSPTQCN